jgi:hypothetical protein
MHNEKRLPPRALPVAPQPLTGKEMRHTGQAREGAGPGEEGAPAAPAGQRPAPLVWDQGEGMPLLGAGGCAVMKVVTAPVGVLSVTRTWPWGTTAPFLTTPM